MDGMIILLVLAFLIIPFYVAGLVGNGAILLGELCLGAAAVIADRGPR